MPCPHSANNEDFCKFPLLQYLSPDKNGLVGPPKSRSGMKGDYLKMVGLESSGGFAGHWVGNGHVVGDEEQKVTVTSGKGTAGSRTGGPSVYTAGCGQTCPCCHLDLSLLHLGLCESPAVSSSLKVCPAPSESWKGEHNPQSIKEKSQDLLESKRH